jgi:glutamate-1-semialdehyde 2,1-aminomutase
MNSDLSSSKAYFAQAYSLFPGGCNSPIRAFKNVDHPPIYLKSGAGAYVYDEDNNKYIDYVLGYGVNILGHANNYITSAIIEEAKNGICIGINNKNEINLANRIKKHIPFIEMLRFTSTGTEACMSAVRLAKDFTKHKKIIKFAGCYHGHSESLISAYDTSTLKVLPYNNLEILEQTLAKEADQYAAIIVEPVAANMGVVLPKEGFLIGLRNLCDKYRILLIFDEVVTGYRTKNYSACNLFNIKPDLICLGKVLGGSTPVAAFGGRADIMSMLAPLGPIFQGGTYSSNSLSMAAGNACLKFCEENNVIDEVIEKTNLLVSLINEQINSLQIKAKITQHGTFFAIEINNYEQLFKSVLQQGIYLAPSRSEAIFLSYAHSEQDIIYTAKAIEKAFKSI